MPPQTLEQRVIRLISDAATDPETDLYARWNKIVEDGVGVAAVDQLGPMPQPTLDDVELFDAVNYAATDADATLRLEPILSRQIDELGLRRALDLDLAITPMVARMQRAGMLVDRQHLFTLRDAFIDVLMDIEYRAHQAAGMRFSLTSGDQVAEVLYHHLRLHSRRRTKGGGRLSTDGKALQSLSGAHPVVPLILEHREISKLQSSYVDKLPVLLSDDGRIRMELGITTVPSGRLNCWGGVNLLAIPVRTDLGREIRRAFIAPPGCVLGAVDLNQIELRAMAILSGDEKMLEAFSTGQDLHALTASQLFHTKAVSFEQRQRGKTINFAIANQISALGLFDQFVVSDIRDVDVYGCQYMLDEWYRLYSRVQPWYESVYVEGRLHGYIRDSLSGRILWTPGLRSPIDKVRAEAERIATNWKIQTFAQVVMKMGMAMVWEYVTDFWESYPGLRLESLLQVHDELLLEHSQNVDVSDDVVALMENSTPGLPIPVKAAWHTGMNWAELK